MARISGTRSFQSRSFTRLNFRINCFSWPLRYCTARDRVTFVWWRWGFVDLVKKKSWDKDFLSAFKQKKWQKAELKRFNEPTRRLYDSQHATTPTQPISAAIAELCRHSKVSHWLESRSRGRFKAGSSFSGFSRFSSRREARRTFSYVLMIRLTTPQPPQKLSAETRPSRQRKLQGCSRRVKPRLAGKNPGMKKEKSNRVKIKCRRQPWPPGAPTRCPPPRCWRRTSGRAEKKQTRNAGMPELLGGHRGGKIEKEIFICGCDSCGNLWN